MTEEQQREARKRLKLLVTRKQDWGLTIHSPREAIRHQLRILQDIDDCVKELGWVERKINPKIWTYSDNQILTVFQATERQHGKSTTKK